MKIFVAHSHSYDYQNELYTPIRNSSLNKVHEFILPHEGESYNTKDIIHESDLVLAEVSLPSTGQGIELGWAEVFQKPIIFIHKKDSQPSRSLRFLSEKFIEYENTQDMISKLEKKLLN